VNRRTDLRLGEGIRQAGATPADKAFVEDEPPIPPAA
jgi:hypothetical protein